MEMTRDWPVIEVKEDVQSGIEGKMECRAPRVPRDRILHRTLLHL